MIFITEKNNNCFTVPCCFVYICVLQYNGYSVESRDETFVKGVLSVRKREDGDIAESEVCAYCENSIVMRVCGRVLCKRGGKLKEVSDTHSCRNFKLDILKLNPVPHKKYNPDIDF